jgi:hypothetical protein
VITYSQLGRRGRFANSLFQICGTIGIAQKSQQPFAFPVFRNYDAKNFGSTEDIDAYKYFVNQLPELPEGLQFQEHGYFWGYEDLNFPVGNWNLNGHFQSERYFSHCMDLIHHYTKMIDEPGCIDAVAVHVRRGDYDDKYHPLQNKYYYRAAFGHVPACEVLLFSDDLNAASDIMDNIGIRHTAVDKDTFESFKIMKNCRHFITANSSYSLMAAILGRQEGKRIVCPGLWFGPSWGAGMNEVMRKDIYPAGAVVL